nr:hypothetical protein [Tanacetum cinerariifolium]
MCDEVAKIMHDEFEMSMMGELNFFLGLQIKQMKDGIFFNKSKYIKEMLKKFDLENSEPMRTPKSFDTKLMKDEEGESVDSTKYQGMIDGDIRMGDSTGVLASLDGEIFSGGKKYQESNIGDSDNTGDEGKIVGGAIGACGRIGVLASLDGEIFSGGKKYQESNIGDSDNTEDEGKIVGGAIRACGRIVRTQPRVPRVSTVIEKIPTADLKFPTAKSTFTADLGNKGKAGNIDDKGYWDSCCSRHMTSNISYLSEYEPYDGGYVSFGQGRGKITGKGIIKTDFKLKDDTNVFLRTPRQHNMYSIDLNNIAPHKNLTCLVAKAFVNESMLWHRRFTWTFFLRTKDETSSILRNFITEIENLKDLKVKIIRCDNGREFRNKEINELCTKKGIRIEFSNARTPQQNRVAERRNRTLIEASRTMVLVNKSQNKTPYELFNSRTPAIGFLRPFGYHVMILNTLDHLEKIDAKGDEATKDVASQAVKKDVSSLRYIALLNWFHKAHMETRNSDGYNADDPKSSGISNPIATLKVPSAKQVEHVVPLTVETKNSHWDFSQKKTPSLDNALTLSNRFEDTFGMEADLSNMETSIPTSPTPTFRIHKDHPKSQIIGPVDTPVQTRHKSMEMEEQSFVATIHQKTNPDLLQFCLFLCFLSQEEPKKIFDALKDPSWVEAMQEELLQFKIQNREGMFLGYKVNDDGLRVCLDKVEAVLSFPSLKCLKDVQRLNGKLASLNRFLSKSAKKSLPFFKTLKKYTKKSDFQWTVKAEMAFKQMKTLIIELPMLTALKEKEELVIYPAAANEVVSAVLMTEGNGKQMPIYFVSRALQCPKIDYTLMEKLIHALRFELERHDIHYRPRTSVKRQILADFIVERPEDDVSNTPMKNKEELSDSTNRSEKSVSECRFQACGQSSKWNLRSKGAMRDQILGEDQKPRQCFQRVLHQTSTQRREQKSRCAEQDDIHNFAHLSKQILVEELKEKSIDKKEVLAIVEEEGHTWMTPIYEYLTEEILPEEKRKARAIRRKTGRYVVTNEILYKRSFLGPWLRCVGPLQANYALIKIHEGSCNMHADPRSVVAKALRSGSQRLGRKGKHEFSNRDASFSLTYGMKAVILVEIGMPSLKTVKFEMIKNDEALEINLGLLEEKKRPGDLVYKSNEASQVEEGGKLGPKWEGPYEVTEALGKEAYKLRDCNGSILPRTWNVFDLKKCYVHEM